MIASNVICDMISFSLPQHRMLKNSLKSTEDECMPLTLINLPLILATLKATENQIIATWPIPVPGHWQARISIYRPTLSDE